jgi:monooxygenase
VTSEEHYDVVIVGAGLSGIGAAVHLKKNCPDRSFTILEGRSNPGGTWDLFRYPGVRSDSDMHTLGYHFKPWRASKSIADGKAILEYIKETATEYNLSQHVKYDHKVLKAKWSSAESFWRLEISHGGTVKHVTGNVLYMCAGYYSYKQGYTPDFPGRERFKGDVIHPQAWPENYDYQDKKVVVIGSGATAITLVPAMADKASHVTMLQRSPTYIISWPAKDFVANFLRTILPIKVAYAITRWKNILRQQYLYWLSRNKPDVLKGFLLWNARRRLGKDFDIEKHFTPTYDVWDQRLCLVPDGDFFDALKEAKASVVTDHIESFTEEGIALQSGEALEADTIITATGLKLVMYGEVEFSVDGKPVDFSKTWSYKGVSCSGVPNFFACFGYVNASWTLRADLMSRYVCRVVNHMHSTGNLQCTPTLQAGDESMRRQPWISGFTPGYINRVGHIFPKQGDKKPWVNAQVYNLDVELLEKEPVDDGTMIFSSPAASLGPGPVL